jgi:transposase
MYHCNFSEQDKYAIEHKRFHDPSPLVRKRMSILWFKLLGYPHHEIAKLSGACPNTITKTILRYQEGGIAHVKKRQPYRPQSQLYDHYDLLAGYFAIHPPATLNQAASEIEKLTGIRRSQTSVRLFLISIKMYRRKVGMIPGKADPDKQEDFINNKLQPVLDEAIAGKRQVYFVDGAHFVLAPFLGFLWSFTRLFIKAPAGRQRFNVLGALNACTHELVTVTNDTYLDAVSVCALLRLLAARHLDSLITLVLDNAKYQKCRLVTELAQSLNIDLLYLTPYSPNLNIIERLWKFVKKKVLYSKYYEKFPEFKKAISSCLAETHTTHKAELDTLLSLKFQRFRKSQMLAI